MLALMCQTICKMTNGYTNGRTKITNGVANKANVLLKINSPPQKHQTSQNVPIVSDWETEEYSQSDKSLAVILHHFYRYWVLSHIFITCYVKACTLLVDLEHPFQHPFGLSIIEQS